MAMYVIADLHLHPQGGHLLHAFYAFVSKLQAGDELYILGDLFNFFVGLDKHNQAQHLVKDTLAEAKTLGISARFIRGNRDFLMTAKEAEWMNMQLLNDVSLSIQFENDFIYPVMLSHGDIFCTNDAAYMSYFQKVHNPCLQGLFRTLPMFVRRKIAMSLREQSQNTDRSVKGHDFYGVVDQTMDDYALKLTLSHPTIKLPLPILVHGHIHEFGLHRGLNNIQQRYALGAWGDKFSYFKLSFTKTNAADNINIHHDTKISNDIRAEHPTDKFTAETVIQPQITFTEQDIDFLFRPETKL